MSSYIFEDHAPQRERRRLLLLEEALDPASIPRLAATGIRPGSRCLELGSGAGSIARWLGEAVGPTGEVVLVDTDTSHVRHLSTPPFRTVTGDFLEVPLAGPFDLVHCRYVLIHNRRSQDMLRRLGALLRPGGILVAEEPDFTSAQRLNPGTDPSQQRVNDAICAMFQQAELDPAYGLSLPAKVADEGLRTLRVEASLHLHRGGDPLAVMMGESTLALRDRYVATGTASQADVERYVERSRDPSLWAVYYATIAVVAEKPGSAPEA